MKTHTRIVAATENDIPKISELTRELASYEKLEDKMVVTEATLLHTLFGPRKYAEVVFLEEGEEKVGCAIFFHNFSTFSGKPGIYLEDLFVKPAHRGKGYGKRLLTYLAKLAVERDCGRLEWSVLDWNKPAIDFYLALGSEPQDGWTVHRLSGDSLQAAYKMAKD